MNMRYYFYIAMLFFAQQLDALNALEYANSLMTQGNRYATEYNFEQAVATYKEILALYPHSAAVQYNLGYALNELTEYQAAADAFKTACALQPTAHNYVAYATALLALREYDLGWKLYEHRWDLPDKKNIPMACSRWNGADVLTGKKIVVLSEGALGDCLQFVQFVQPLKAQGAYIIAYIPQALVALCSHCPFLDEVIAHGNSIPRADYYTSLMSLPALLASHIKTNSIPNTYLVADPELCSYWRTVLDGSQKGYKIGICWQADKANDANRPPRARRSINGNLFTCFAQLHGVIVYSLQYQEPAPAPIVSFGPSVDTEHGRFMDTAAIMRNLDLVITVDTAIAHLAGGLGVTTWLILPYKADWRWGKDGSTTPFYSTMKLFRQKKDESVASLLNEMIDELQRIVPCIIDIP